MQRILWATKICISSIDWANHLLRCHVSPDAAWRVISVIYWLQLCVLLLRCFRIIVIWMSDTFLLKQWIKWRLATRTYNWQKIIRDSDILTPGTDTYLEVMMRTRTQDLVTWQTPGDYQLQKKVLQSSIFAYQRKSPQFHRLPWQLLQIFPQFLGDIWLPLWVGCFVD